MKFLTKLFRRSGDHSPFVKSATARTEYACIHQAWVYVTSASVPVVNPFKTKRPFIFHAIIDGEQHEALQKLLQHGSDFLQIFEEFDGINAVEYAIMERRTTIAGMLIGKLTELACHSESEREASNRLLCRLARVSAYIEEPVWLAAIINAIALGTGPSFASSGIARAALSDTPVATCKIWLQNWMGQKIGTDAIIRQRFLGDPLVQDLLNVAVVDTILLKAAMGLTDKHGTTPISFSHFSHGGCVRHELQNRLDKTSGFSDERAFATLVLKVTDGFGLSSAQLVQRLQQILDSKALGRA